MTRIGIVGLGAALLLGVAPAGFAQTSQQGTGTTSTTGQVNATGAAGTNGATGTGTQPAGSNPVQAGDATTTAQTATPGTGTNATAIGADTNAGPAKGANSFTQGQAQSRLADAGYTSVADLKKDGDGIWRGSAMKGGQKVSVWLDYQGKLGQQ